MLGPKGVISQSLQSAVALAASGRSQEPTDLGASATMLLARAGHP